MVAILWKGWDFARYLLRPEDGTAHAHARRLARAVKALFWTAVAIGVGIELGQAL